MAFAPADLSAEAIALLTEPRTIAAFATRRADGRPHVASVGYTYEHAARVVRIVTMPRSQKVKNVEAGSDAVLNQIDGMRWLQLEGPAIVHHDAAARRHAYELFAKRYGRVHEDDELCVVEMHVQRCLGPANGWGRVGFDPSASAAH